MQLELHDYIMVWGFLRCAAIAKWDIGTTGNSDKVSDAEWAAVAFTFQVGEVISIPCPTLAAHNVRGQTVNGPRSRSRRWESLLAGCCFVQYLSMLFLLGVL